MFRHLHKFCFILIKKQSFGQLGFCFQFNYMYSKVILLCLPLFAEYDAIVFFDLKRERFSGKVSGTIYFSLESALNYMFMAVRSIIYTRDKKHWILCGLITATVCAYELNNARKRITKIYLHISLQFLDHIFRKK